MEAARTVKEGGGENDLIARLKTDPLFASVADRFDEILKPEAFTGMASQQVADYLATVVKPALEAHAADRKSSSEEVRV